MSSARAVPLVVAAIAATVLAGGAVVACSSSPVIVQPPKTCTLQVIGMTIIASPRINLEEDGTPRPVQLRLYQLKTDSRLLGATFEDIWHKDKDTLKDDLVKVDEFPVYPDTRSEVKFERDQAALFVVGVALFRNPQGRSWYTEFELPPAPGKGDCMNPDPKCSGPDCNKDGGGPPLKPHFSLWLDESRIDDGADHLDEFPEATRIRQLYLRSAPAQGAGGEATPAPTSAQQAPTGNQQ
ncbi:MAG TPA: type VI secretion system lipoprotein TssJ [Polyangiaceae bacterium]|jgi:type VI secretion system protein VasD